MTAVRGREAREYRIRFERAVLYQAHASIEYTAGHVMMLMPGRECGDDQAGVRRLYLRTRSNVSRT